MPLRAERAAKAAELRAQGMTGTAIAQRMGISKAYAYALLTDPDGTGDRARKDRYRNTCVDCGGPCTGSSGRVGGCERCRTCAAEHQRKSAKWTRENIVAAVRRWNDLYGAPPKSTDWKVAAARCDHERFYSGDWPHTTEVQQRFGNWNPAIEAAGFTPRRAMSGGPGHGPGSLSKADLDRTIELHRAGVPHEEIGAEFGITSGGVAERLKRAGEPIGGRRMPTRLTATDVIGRELKRMQDRATQLQRELDSLQQEIDKLEAAKQALNGKVPAA